MKTKQPDNDGKHDDGNRQLLGTPARLVRAALRLRSEDRQRPIVVKVLRHDPATVVPMALQLAGSSLVTERFLGVWLLAEPGYPRQPFRRQRVEMLRQRLEKDAAPRVRARAARSLGRISGADTQRVLLGYQRDPVTEVRQAVAESLRFKSGDIQAEQALVQLARDCDPQVREWAAFSLGNWWPRLRPRSLKILLGMLEDPDQQVRHEAIWALVRHRRPEAVTCLLSELAIRDVEPVLCDTVHELALQQGTDR
jgi:hypothetical protein